MCSIISFGNVRMSGMGKNLVTSYAALGVGLAVVLTFGLTAISSVMEQPSQSQFTVSNPDLNLSVEPQAGPEAERKALEAVPTAPPEAPEAQEDVSPQAGAPSAGGGESTAEVPMLKAPVKEEATRESYSIAAEVSTASSPFAGILVALPYIAAATVGSVVFAVTRKRVGW